MNDTAHHVPESSLIDVAMGLIEGRDSAWALSHMKVCGQCEARFRDVVRESEILRARRRPATPPRQQTGTAEESPAESRRGRRFRWMAWGTAAAAILVLAALGIGRLRLLDPLDYWLPVESEREVVRSGDAAADDAVFADAIEAYRRRDTARVVSLLESRQLVGRYEPLKIMLASALVREGRAVEARDLLVAMHIDTLPLPSRDRARWVLLTALGDLGDRSAMKTLLDDLASRPGEFSARARRQLDRWEP